MVHPFDQSNSERLRHIHDALDWLEAHPEAHIKNALAMTAPYGMRVPHNDPAAKCWCITGRIALEAGLADQYQTAYHVELVGDYLMPFFEAESPKSIRCKIQDINDFARPNKTGKRAAIATVRSMFPARP